MRPDKYKVESSDDTGPIDHEAIRNALNEQKEFNILNQIQKRKHYLRTEDVKNEKIEPGRLKESFKYALKGIVYAFKTQPNVKIHFIAAVLALIMGICFQISFGEWLILVLVIGFVITMEFVNTAIETLVDLYTDKYLYLAGVAKDLGASMVLVMSVTAAVVGLIIFVPRIVTLIGGLIG